MHRNTHEVTGITPEIQNPLHFILAMSPGPGEVGLGDIVLLFFHRDRGLTDLNLFSLGLSFALVFYE